MEIPKKHGKGKAATFRRYPAGKYRAYDEIYLRERAESNILNSGNRSYWDLGKYNTLTAVEDRLYEYLGDDKGEVYNSRTRITKPAIIPGIRLKLKEVEQRVKSHTERQIADGYQPKAPGSLRDKKLRLEALLDVAGAEAEWLLKKKKEFQNQRAEQRQKKILPYGPRQQQKGEPAQEIDGQQVSRMRIGDDFILVINEPDSPYDGMALADYRLMAINWSEMRRKELDQKMKLRQEQIQETGSSNIVIPMANRRVSKDDLPRWPDGVPCYSYKKK